MAYRVPLPVVVQDLIAAYLMPSRESLTPHLYLADIAYIGMIWPDISKRTNVKDLVLYMNCAPAGTDVWSTTGSWYYRTHNKFLS